MGSYICEKLIGMKTVIDILGIALPVLLLGLLFFRSKSKLLNIISILVVLVLLLAGIVRYLFFGETKSSHHTEAEVERLSAGKHSFALNQSIQAVLDDYYKMTEAFVNWDTAAINRNATSLGLSIENLKLDELKKDTSAGASALYQTAIDYSTNSKNRAISIAAEAAIDKKRELLNGLSDDLRLLLITMEYDQAKLYWQECPMAFNGDIPGYWLSDTSAVRNPYMGLRHPQYKDEMLACGGPKATIDFTAKDTIGTAP